MYDEQIRAFQEKRNEASTRMKSIMDKAAEEGRTLDETETEEYEALATDVKSIDSHLKRLEDLERAEGERADPIVDKDATDNGKPKAPGIVRRTDEQQFKGQRFIQVVKSRAVASMDSVSLREAVQSVYGKGRVDAIMKAADPVVAADVAVGPAAQDFVDVLRDGAIFDNLEFRPAAVGIPIVRKTVKSVGYWVGEGAATTASKWALESITLGPKKVGGIVPISIEAVRDSSVDADRGVMMDLAEALREVLDAKLVSTDAVGATVPKGLRNSAPHIVASDTTAAALIADIKGLLLMIPEQLHGGVVLLMRPFLAHSIAMIRTALNVPVFPGMSINGGDLEGIPVKVSTAVPSGVIIGVVPREYYAVLNGGVEIAVSREATIAGTSLFENGLLGFRALRSVNWTERRSGVDLTAYISGAAYGGAPTDTT